jgi:hypothetical protein|tara:strand:+ start:368 stop:562 length:195 start_codon:yes stop_codon:yes gene_type:complete
MTEELYSYLFHYNHHTGLWSAIPREKHDEYWNDAKSKGILRSKSIGTLITLINKGDDFIKKIKK